MAHKAKSKSILCLAQQRNTKPKVKNAQKKTKAAEKMTTTASTEAENMNLPSCSFTEPIVRVVSPPVAKKGSGPPRKPQPDENETIKTSLIIIHKRREGSVNTDIIGAKALTTWKNSSGRSKSWAKCRRKKLSQVDLKLLVELQTRSVALGWRTSSTVTPASFLRSQGLGVNSAPTRKRSSATRTSSYLAIEHDRETTLPRGHSLRAEITRQGNEGRAEWGFLRLTMTQDIVSLTREAYLTVITLPTCVKTSGEETKSNARGIRTFPVLSLLRNDSHADVYLIQNSYAPFEWYHAHAFLNDSVAGKRATFAKRKMNHLRRSRCFIFEVLQEGRTIIIMEPEAKGNELRLKLSQNDFPLLPGTGEKSTGLDICFWG